MRYHLLLQTDGARLSFHLDFCLNLVFFCLFLGLDV